MVDTGEITVGMVVDRVTGVLEASREKIEPPSPVVTTAASTFIRGIAKIDELVILLDLSKVLTVEEREELGRLSEAV